MLERDRIAKSLHKLSEDLAAESKRSQRSTSLSKTLHKAKTALQDQQQQQEEEAGKMDGSFSATTATSDGKPLLASSTVNSSNASASATASAAIIPYDEKVGDSTSVYVYRT